MHSLLNERAKMEIPVGSIIDIARITLETAESAKGLAQTHYLISEAQAQIFEGKIGTTDKFRFGVMFRLKSFWVGVHYSDYCKRFCINFVPCITLWLVFKGGQIPRRDEK